MLNKKAMDMANFQGQSGNINLESQDKAWDEFIIRSLPSEWNQLEDDSDPSLNTFHHRLQ